MQFQPVSNAPPDAFTCETCGQRYTRLDHLTRHIRSHTQERPFQCTECGKAFARTDLLKRHALGHETQSPNKKQKIVHPPTRSRAAQACVACARSKLRCDGAEVCSRCQKRDIACVYKAPQPTMKGEGSSMLTEASHEQPSPSVNLIANRATMSGTTAWSNMPVSQTPMAFEDSTLQDQPSVEASASNIDFDDSYLADFLKDIMHTSNPMGDAPYEQTHDVNFVPKDFLDFNMPISFDYLDAYELPRCLMPQDDSNLAVDTGDISAPPELQAKSGHATPTGKNGLGLSAQAFQESLWLWTPHEGQSTAAEHAMLSTPVEAFLSMEKEGLGEPPFPPLSQMARDQVLAAVLAECDRKIMPVIVSSFPSAELLTVLMHRWITYHRNQIDTWFHFADFDPNTESTGTLIALCASGAALSRNPRIRKLGYALQEAARLSDNRTFETDNRNIRRLRPMQALCLSLEAGFWSGDKRKVEIAESFSATLVTMFRRGSYFTKPDDYSQMPNPNDTPSTLQRKWKTWIEAESLRRLAAHLLIRDSQISASLLTPPLISFSEPTCPLPALRSLWMAETAEEWATLMHSSCKPPNNHREKPSLRACLNDMSLIPASRHTIDAELATLAMAHAFWGPCWQHRQIEAVVNQHGDEPHSSSGLLSNSVKQETVRNIQQFRLLSSEVQDSRPEATLASERVLMNLHVSLDDVHLLAGKAGEKEARRKISTLKHWSRGPQSRQAIWHAGQIIRAARQYTRGTLRDASAIAVYHAGVVLWAYSILTNADRRGREASPTNQEVMIDDEAPLALERFVMLGKGVPVIRAYTRDGRMGQVVPLSDAKRVLRVIVEMLQVNNGSTADDCPPLVENLNKLMRSLGNAARCMRGVEMS